VDSASSFNWSLFLKRTWAAYVIGGLWIVESIVKHDQTGIVFAFAIGFVLAPAIGYFWTRSSTKTQ
jgi:hypothetical protein